MTSIGIRCDAGPRTGVGHLVRCVALAEELTARGVDVHFLSDLGGLEWAAAQLDQRGLPWHPAPYDEVGLVAAAERLNLDALVVDSYTLPPSHSRAVRRTGRTVLAIVDGDPRGQDADIYVDQNLDAALDIGDVRLAGLDYALLRASVRRLRPSAAPVHSNARTPKVVAFFGGTDAYRAAPQVARLLAWTAAPFDATVIAADDGLRTELLAVRPGEGQTLHVIEPTDRLPELLADADLVVSASGTSTWELLCLGRAAALVWVVDNQIRGYERTVARGYAAGLGRLGELGGEAVTTLRRLLLNPGDRTALAVHGWAAVDGRGVERVADSLLRERSPR
ncbi:UDP-2,4-diacetamido-2,4,6-trideoxy-beta-L-altropyranose hydrolase [Actinoplanes lobatus]|uniref:Spore coat polysaccharide biosynthesis predicted glycosyltransferase SpsG n=1 Tax=Actinoplanes lobatus TaxID=113568 RepID=A0A7W7MFI9_9ACTN|nr:spore coat protein [Actinoplanes lobatus]MBB4748291.1 spore coat polysaccharide biosynthesis predicted glycosyltransferase SpsG [Actinoplanes lobatus]GGN70625.1 UDP-2,4-diacetamido-2,4,6-trideoxy-beta-L-altropyranose hydrolase [Actinoplanes lobatus]GIE40141.1 UDP-2,4-diacetamido-2,4,6-trideoxy-beta-L-altropy ranose hydrolase [Actinoplanes lobatus]